MGNSNSYVDLDTQNLEDFDKAIGYPSQVFIIKMVREQQHKTPGSRVQICNEHVDKTKVTYRQFDHYLRLFKPEHRNFQELLQYKTTKKECRKGCLKYLYSKI